MQCFFKPFFGFQNETLKFCNDTLNSESQDLILPCIEVKRNKVSMFSCTWLLQQMAEIVTWACVHFRGHRLVSAFYYTAAHLYSVQNCEYT